MRNYTIYILIFLTSLSTITSCGRCADCNVEPVTYQYNIINNSGAKIEIIPFSYSENQTVVPLFQDKIAIEDTKSHPVQYNDGAPFNGFSYKTMLKAEAKIEIIFNNSKKLTYNVCGYDSSCDDVRNIFNPLFNDEMQETYNISSADYQNATSCNGNCY